MKQVKKFTSSTVARLESDANKIWFLNQQIEKLQQQKTKLLNENSWLVNGIDCSHLTDDERFRAGQAAAHFGVML